MNNQNINFCATKENLAIFLMAMCDAKRRFVWFEMTCNPENHDSRTIKNGALP